MNRLIQCKTTILPLLIAGVLACFGLLPKAEAVVPAPDGGYPGGNTAEGQAALFSLTTGTYNTAVGLFSLRALTTGNFNTAIGAAALPSNSADENTATGAGALLSNTTGGFNTANGAFALLSNTTGLQNTANGAFALRSNTTGVQNTATGVSALFNNTTGSRNTADGTSALYGNTTASGNTATGWQALFSNTIGYDNTANGASALVSNTTGWENTAVGANALASNTTINPFVGVFNTATGSRALFENTTGISNTAIGAHALFNNTTGSGNVALGVNAGAALTTGNNNIAIGVASGGSGAESSTIRIGTLGVQDATYIVGIWGGTVTDGAPVLVDAGGHLGTVVSSARFKDDIKPMDKASEAILAFKPVTFHYKTDTKGTAQFGLIAEEVAEVNPDLVVRDKDGKPYSVRYDQVNAMLLNEFLKEHRKVEAQNLRIQEQEATIAQLKKEMETVVARLSEHDSRIQRVSAQIGLSKAVGQTALNNP
jgi:Chaperone of endosialidase